MNISVFAKNRETKDGKKFTSYISKLLKKDGSELTVSVKFREECGAPEKAKCPCVISVDKNKANLSKRETVDTSTGEIVTFFTLWVNNWKYVGEYIDHSLDDFD